MATTPDFATQMAMHPVVLAMEALRGTIEEIEAQTRVMNGAEATRLELIEKARRQMQAMQAVPDEELRRTGGVRFQSDELADRSLAQEVGHALGVHERTGGNRIYCAEVVTTEFTATLETLREGRIAVGHAQTMADTAIGLPEEQRLEFERLALKKAVQQTSNQFITTARKIRDKLHPELLEERHRTAFDDRDTRVDPAHDAMARFTIHHSVATIFGIDDRVTAIARHLKTIPGENRTLTQLRSDIAAQILLHGDIYDDIPIETTVREVDDATPAGSAGAGTNADADADAGAVAVADDQLPIDNTPDDDAIIGVETVPVAPRAPGRGRYARFRPSVHITVPVMTLLGQTDEPASLDGYGPIPLSMAREIAGEATSFIRILTHPETGAVLSVGRDSYRVPKDLARWVQTRDGTCRQRYCARPARRSDIDHTKPWTPQKWRPQGGQTSDDNLECLCGSHHTSKHALLVNGWGHVVGEAWGLRHETDANGHTTGTIIWTTPTGREYSTEPDLKMDPYRPDAG